MWPWERVETRLLLRQYNSARCTRPCLRSDFRPKPPHRKGGTRRQNRSNESQGGPIRPHCLPHPTGADPVALSPINPLLYSRIFPSLTNRPPRTYSIIPCWSKQASIKDLKASPSSQHRILIDQLSAVCQEELHAALVKQLIKSQIALLKSVPVIRFPCHPPAPPLHHFLDHRFEGLQMADNRRRTLKERVKPGRRMFSLCNVLQ